MKKQEKKYSDALIEIENIITKLEAGETDFDVIKKEVKQATDLIRFCKEKLFSTEKELNDLMDEVDEA